MSQYAEMLRIALTCIPASNLLGVTYSPEEAAKIAGCDVDTLAAKANTGEVPGLKWGRSWVYPALPFHLSLSLQASGVKPAPAPTTQEVKAVGTNRDAANEPKARGRRTPPALPNIKTA